MFLEKTDYFNRNFEFFFLTLFLTVKQGIQELKLIFVSLNDVFKERSSIYCFITIIKN